MTTTFSNQGISSSDDGHGMTAMLISISILFLITQTPYLITNNMYFRIVDGDYSADYLARFYLIETCCRILVYVNNIANFFCYCVAGKKFRSELIDMIKGWCRCYDIDSSVGSSKVTISTVT